MCNHDSDFNNRSYKCINFYTMGSTTTQTFEFYKDEQGTWTITASSPTNNDSETLLTVVAHPPATAHHERPGSSFKGPKSLTVYAGTAPASSHPSPPSLQNEKSGGGAADTAGANTSFGVVPTDNMIGTVKCHETLSLKSDVVLNSKPCSMDREFTSSTGLGKLEWSSDLAAAKEKREVGELRSVMLLRPHGDKDKSGYVLCRVSREEVVARAVGGEGETVQKAEHLDEGDRSSIDGKKDPAHVEVKEKQQQKVLGRHTWKFTRGEIEVATAQDGAALTEGQLQEVLTSAVVEIERRLRMQATSNGTTIGMLASAAAKSLFIVR